MEDERELVECERGPAAEREGHQLEPRAPRPQGERQRPGHDHGDDAEHGMMHVQAAGGDHAADAQV